jgi:hypothetical protein
MTEIRTALLGFVLAALALPAYSSILMFDATLTGAQQTPPNASPATGLGTVLLDDVADTITVNFSWSGLIGGPATAAHIHGPAPVGASAPVLFPFTGVPAATSGSIPQQVFSITPTQIGQLEAGLYYFNIHNAQFPAGEIRGQIGAVPEPATLVMLAAGIGILGLQVGRRRRS